MNQWVFAKVLVVMFLVMGACKSQEQESSWSSSISSLEVHSGREDSSSREYLALGGGSDEQVCSKAISDLCILLEQGQSVDGGIFKRRLLAVPLACQDQLRQAFNQVYGAAAAQKPSTDLSTCYFEIHDRVPFLAGS